MSYDILKNTSLTVSPGVEVRDTGWEISGGYATHSPCNPGTMRSIGSLGIEVGKTYAVTYTVDNYISGGVRVNVGGTQGTIRNAAGTYTENLLCINTAEMSFYSDGALRISGVKFFEFVEVIGNSVTLAFYDGEGKEKKWVTHYSYAPELMIRFINKFFSLKNGQLWLHNVNETRNNFYGVQSVSKIQFYANINPTNQKIYFSMREQGDSIWYCPELDDIVVLASDGRPAGMKSRLTKNRFNNYQGSYFVDFLRNALDPRFTDTITALFQAEPLRGRFMEITLTNDDTRQAILYEVDIKSSPSSFTY